MVRNVDAVLLTNDEAGVVGGTQNPEHLSS